MPTAHDITRQLKLIRDFAARAHGSQMRKYASEPYNPPFGKGNGHCKEHLLLFLVMAAALLHDLLEGTPVSKKDLRAFLERAMNAQDATKTFSLVKELTNVYTKADFPAWNRNKRKQKELERIRRPVLRPKR